MGDLKQGNDANLKTPSVNKKDLSALQVINKDISCNVGTQTVDNTVWQSISPEDEPLNLNPTVNTRISHRPSSRSKKSSFRLFLVPDEPDMVENDAFRDSGLRLSFDEEQHENNAQSLRFSVISNEWEEENMIPEPLHDYKDSGGTKKSRNTFTQNLRSRKRRNTVSSVDFEKTNSDGTIDHQLMHSANPCVLAWLRLKNFEEREKRKHKKREKKELRRNAYEEAEKRQKRIEESEKRFVHWLKAKKKEARCTWREKRARKRVDITEREETIHMDNDAPPNYTVVPSFKGVQACAGERLETKSVLECQEDVTQPSGSFETQLNPSKQELSNEGDIVENNAPNLVGLDKDNYGENNNCERPATAHGRLFSVSGTSTKLSKRYTCDKWQREHGNKRPSTSAGRLTKDTDTMVDNEIKGITHEAWVMQKRKERKMKKLKTMQSSYTDSGGGKKPYKASITFEAWKAQKRQVDKEKAKEKKREEVDEALTEAIIKMARGRVENSSKEKRQLDTGMPKWRARNRVRSREKNAGVTNTSPSKYAVIQLLGDENDDHEVSDSKEVATIQKSCEYLKLD